MSDASVAIIVACESHGGIGRKGTIPWHISEDLKRFRVLTKGHVVIMGRLTWESLPHKPLEDRVNIVITSQTSIPHAQHFVKTLALAIDLAADTYPERRIFIIGGEQVYKEALVHFHNLVDTVYLTWVRDHIPDCDTFFPLQDMFNNMVLAGSDEHEECTFMTFQKR
jgi:dihydrofolate reductase